MRPFRSLHAVLAAHLQGDEERAIAAFDAVDDAAALCAQATRHKCGAILFEAAMRQRTKHACARTVVQSVKTQMAMFALDAQQTREQICGIVRALSDARVPFALLKGSARLYAGDTLAERTQTFDIDILTPSDASDACVAALCRAGYAFENDAHVAGYRQYHHHLAPLVHPKYRKAIEVHVALASPEKFSSRCDWRALESEMETIDGPAGPVVRLNAVGRAWHMALHGAPLYRLGDAVQMALEALRHDGDVLEELAARAQGERILRIPLQAVIHVAASLAGLPLASGTDAQRYAAWASRREDLPPFFRARAQFVDAWFANGRAIAGPATPLALPRAVGANGVPVPLRRRLREFAGSTFVAAALAVRAPLKLLRS